MIKNEIGTNAGRIWNYMDSNGECAMETLKKKIKLKDVDLYLALGWLARENKIAFYNKENAWIVFQAY